MPVDLFQPLTNPITKETFRTISASADAYVFEWIVAPGGYVPFEHIHLAQDEIFRIETGEVRLVIDGKEFIGKPGDVTTVPKGKRHIAYNNKNETLKAIVEFRPGLDMHLLDQCYNGLLLDGEYDRKGAPPILKLGYFMKGMQAVTRPTSVPAFGLGLMVNFSYCLGILLGWEKLYKKYTGREMDAI
jgi:mannose-6-phosphate isomerase-like protein (cupin superfamily)